MNNCNSYLRNLFPRFFVLLSTVEMCERFSYYGMRSLLILFLTSYIGLDDKNAYVTYSLFTAITFVFPIFSGFLADKIMGFRLMVLIGGIITTLGYLAIALSGNNSYLIYLGLGLIGTGTGLYKGNITNLLGACYGDSDPRRSQGFTLFYVGVNIGSFVSSILCSYVVEVYGWHYGFSFAGVGIISGLILFLKFQNILSEIGLSPCPEFINKSILGVKPFWLILVSGILVATLCAEALIHKELFTNVLKYYGVLIIGIFIYIVYKMDANERPKMYVVAIMNIFLMLFFALGMQLASLINLFTDRNVDKKVLDITLPIAVSQSINPLVIIVGGFIFSIVFNFGKHLDIFRIFISIIAMASCFLVLYIGCMNADENGQINYLYLFIGISLMSLGEIFITPVVQSYISMLAPNKIKGLVMGMMLLPLAFSNLAGIITSEFMSIPAFEGQIDSIQSLEIYKGGFLNIAKFYMYLSVIFIPFGLYIHKVLKNIINI